MGAAALFMSGSIVSRLVSQLRNERTAPMVWGLEHDMGQTVSPTAIFHIKMDVTILYY